MGLDTYNSITPSSIEQRPYTALSAIDNSDRDFMSQAASMQSLEAMMRGQMQKQAELERYRGVTPGEIDKSNYEGAWARQRMDPSFLESQMRGSMGEHQSKIATGAFDQATNPGKISLTNAGNRNDEMVKVGQFMQMIHASHGPEAADQLYQQVRTGLDPKIMARMPSHYDPKNWDAMLEEASRTPQARAASALERQKAGHKKEEIEAQKGADIARTELHEIAETHRNRETIAGRQAVAREQAGSRESHMSPAQRMQQLRRQLAQNPDDDFDHDEYKMYVEDRWAQREERDPTIFMSKLQAQSAKDPAAKEAAMGKYRSARQTFMEQQGIFENAPPRGTVRRFPDGDRKFKGGYNRNPADPKNWEKV